MQTKTFVSILASAIIVANVAIMGIAYAATTTGEVGVSGGGLSINSAPSVETFGSVVVSTTDQSTGDYIFGDAIEFEDTRDTGAEYSVTVTATDFEDELLNIDVTNLQIATDSLDDASGGVTDCLTGFTTLETMTYFSDDDDDGTSNASALVNASGQDSITHCSVTPMVNLDVPAYTPAGDYQSTLTFTIS